MELRQLRYFVAVAEELHFTRAAERLHIGQPPLSHAIQLLEADLGTQLFERTKRWVRLTDAGKFFLQDAQRILALTEQAAVTARRAGRGEVGELRIGFLFSTPLTPLFATTINRYRERYPDVTLRLQEMPTLRQLEAIALNNLDLGFIRPPETPVSKSMLLTTLHEDKLRLVVPSAHPLAARASVALSELAGQPFIMYSSDVGTGISPQILRLCRAAGFEPDIAQMAGDASTIIGLIAAGCGVSILPASFERVAMEGVCYRPIRDRAATTTLQLAQRRDERSPLVDAFVALTRAAA